MRKSILMSTLASIFTISEYRSHGVNIKTDMTSKAKKKI